MMLRRIALAICCLTGATAPALAQFGPPIMDAVDVTTTDTHIEVVLLFNCQIRYLSHLPREEGDALDVRLTLGPDCRSGSGLVASETMAGPAGEPVLKGVDLTPLLADDIDVRFNWQRRERFLVVPTSDQRGLRIRLLRGDRDAEQSRVIITEAEGDLITGYAINLESSRTPFSSEFATQAEKSLGLKTYLSDPVIDGQQWYRLRLGPFPTRAEAERQLLRAQASYPRAWLAIADEVLHDTGDAGRTAVQADSPVNRSGLIAAPAGLLSAAQAQMRQKKYDTAIASLTRYLESATGDDRATALELLGLARERNGQLAHAKAEYEAYLREYQSGRGADRVRRRLNALRTAGGINSTGGNADKDPELAWRFFGGASQYYRMDDNQRTTGDTTAQFTSQNALLTDFDLVARRRGINFDSIVRVNAGYLKDLLSNGPGDKVRVSSAFVELGDVETGWLARAGRQSRSSEGLLGTFDGVFGSYRWLPHLTFNGAVGFPVESTRSGFRSDRQFTALAANFGIFDRAWEPALYIVNQMYDGETDRQAVGVEVRYFRPGRTFVGFVDYDLHFQELNSTVLVGTMQLPGQWSMSLDIEQRESPVLTTRNALIGQPVPTLSDLLSLFTSEEIRQLAVDRTSPTEIYGMSLSRPLGERLQFTLNASSSTTGATVPSGGVEGFPDTGADLAVSAQLLAMSLFRAGDINILGIRFQSGETADTESVGISSRIPVFDAWRLGPQLRVDRRVFKLDESEQLVLAPSLRVALQQRKVLFEFEAGAEFATRTNLVADEKTKRYFFSLGYRWSF